VLAIFENWLRNITEAGTLLSEAEIEFPIFQTVLHNGFISAHLL
jgi:hypothetical protein